MYNSIKEKLSRFSADDIENGIMLYCLTNYNRNVSFYDNKGARRVAAILSSFNLSTNLEIIIELFESLLEQSNKNKNGIVFTPYYIAKYMFGVVYKNANTINKNPTIIDPGCGCGIFLVAAVETILKHTSKYIDSIIQECIYGIDIDADNVRRCKLVLRLLSAKHGGNFQSIHPNVICANSLKINWRNYFNIEKFDYIIGNPPYVNPHEMDKETVQFLKKHFYTTKNGVFNIFYAFIEKGMNELTSSGILTYIVPNNFFTIKSAVNLREYLQKNMFIGKILDFGVNMAFKPTRTYNCIIQLNKNNNSIFDYCVLPKTDDIEYSILNAKFDSMETNVLDKNGWKLVDKQTRNNLQKIENQSVSIKNFIRAGIATLRDSVYMVNKDNFGYYKMIEFEKFYIEADLVKPLYKISDLKYYTDIENVKRYIIFPYLKSKSEYKLITEKKFAAKYPKTYEYLKIQREELSKRDKGKEIKQGWYAYGRTQGLNKYGKKLLFPTFANKPKFVYTENEDALFCNGYAVFENERYDLDILSKILNSNIMEYYISNTSYSIEGGYYCYQKKYVERFSLPSFTEENLAFIRNASKKDLDGFLWKIYNLE